MENLYPPIAVMIPDKIYSNQKNLNKLLEMAEIDSVMITSSFYVDNYHDSVSFYNTFNSLEEAVNEIQKPELFYFHESVPLEPLAQSDKLLEINRFVSNNSDLLGSSNMNYLPFLFTGRMMMSNNIILKSNQLGGQPIITAPTSFHWFCRKIQENQSIISTEDFDFTGLNLTLTNALMSEGLDWLSNISTKQLIKLREQGSLKNIRRIFNEEITSINLLDGENIKRVINQVDLNLQRAISQHKVDIKTMKVSLGKGSIVDIASLLMSATVAFQPLISPLAPIWTSAIATVAGGTNLKNIIWKAKSCYDQKMEIDNSPLAILWETKMEGE